MSEAMRRIAIVDWHAKREFYRPLTDAFPADWIDVSPPGLAHGPPDVDLVLVNDETWPFCAAGIAAANRRGIPTLHLPDGACEWRNTWERTRPVPFMQPILASRIACLGRAQARLLESWGNEGACVVTGSPRFDWLVGREPRRPRQSTVLVATARQPFFHEHDRRAVVAALGDLREWFAAHPAIRPVWRLTAGLEEAIGVPNALAVPLPDQLAAVDAVISTPSNLVLESMAHGLPVALLDYTNSPPYIVAAWSITAAVHIEAAVAGLLEPDARRMDWQRTLLADQLECRTPATPRVIALMERMMGAAPVPAPEPVGSPRGRERALEAEIAHLRAALALRPTQVVYRALCELKRRLGR